VQQALHHLFSEPARPANAEHMTDNRTPPKYNVSIVEAVILEIAAEFDPEHLPIGALLMKVVGDLNDAREVSVGTQAIHRLKEVGLFAERTDQFVEPTDAGLRAVEILK
jgi:hypothetical protein